MYSIVDYTATADQENFNVTMPYIDESHIHVYINDVEVDSQFLVFNTPTVVTLTDVDEDTPHPAVAEGDTVRVQRTTPLDEAVVDYANGSNLGESDLDTQTLQLLYVAQEQDDLVSVAIEAAEAIEESVDFITTTAADIEAAIDAAAGSLQATIEAARDAALAAQTAAELAETNAETAETNAELAETNAETAETGAVAAKVAAEAARDAALAAQTAAELAETNAETAETNAETAETNAEAAQTAAEAARDAALAAQTAAELAETNAETAETNAETAETNAETAQAAAEAAAAEVEDIATALEGFTTKGDLIVAAAAGTAGNLGVGQQGQSLVVDEDSSVGLSWVGPLMPDPIINGDFTVWQRGSGPINIATGENKYLADRWSAQVAGGSAGIVTYQLNTIGPTVAEAGRAFTLSATLGVNTIDASIAAGEYAVFRQTIEGYFWRPFAQQTLTLSFWVRANKTGTYCVSVSNAGLDRSYVAEYTISASDTWEFKTITIDASPSAGSWSYTNGMGLIVRFALAAGSTYHTTAGAWQTGNFISTSNQVNFLDNTSNQLTIVGVQLNKGLFPIPYGGRPFGTELALCQRYYEAGPNGIWSGDVTTGNGYYHHIWYLVQKRAAPTVTMTDIGNNRFPAGSPTNWANNTNGFISLKTSNSTGAIGFYHFSWTSDAEI